MSNLRIKNKRLKRELELLKKQTRLIGKIECVPDKAVTFRSSLALTPDDLDHIPECIEQVKRSLLNEVKDCIHVQYIGFDPSEHVGLSFSILKADLKIVKED